MNKISDIDEMNNLYEKPSARSVKKVSDVITPLYRQWIESSRFVVLATVGHDGCDASPRGDVDNLVKIPDPGTVLIPDWRGNNRLDSLRNIVTDGRTSLMFMSNGCNTVIRVNGRAVLTADKEITGLFQRQEKTPVTVIAVTVKEVYFQCAKALMRSDLWASESAVSNLPTAGQFLKEQEADFDARSYDEGYQDYAGGRMW